MASEHNSEKRLVFALALALARSPKISRERGSGKAGREGAGGGAGRDLGAGGQTEGQDEGEGEAGRLERERALKAADKVSQLSVLLAVLNNQLSVCSSSASGGETSNVVARKLDTLTQLVAACRLGGAIQPDSFPTLSLSLSLLRDVGGPTAQEPLARVIHGLADTLCAQILLQPTQMWGQGHGEDPSMADYDTVQRARVSFLAQGLCGLGIDECGIAVAHLCRHANSALEEEGLPGGAVAVLNVGYCLDALEASVRLLRPTGRGSALHPPDGWQSHMKALASCAPRVSGRLPLTSLYIYKVFTAAAQVDPALIAVAEQSGPRR